jgi:hypothetical protein
MAKLTIPLFLFLSLSSYAQEYTREAFFEAYEATISLNSDIFMNFTDKDFESNYGINKESTIVRDNQFRSYNDLSRTEKDQIQRVTDTIVYDYTNASDKHLHFSAGYIIGSISSEVCSPIYRQQTNKSRQLRFWCSFGAATIAGVAKEFYDSTGRGEVEAADALATSFGGLQIELKF